MLKFNIVLEAENVIEDDFWCFIEVNEICTVQADCDIDIDSKKWNIQLVPAYDEDRKEFMILCSNLVDYLIYKGYEV